MNKAPNFSEAADEIHMAGYLIDCAFLAASNLNRYERDAIQAVLNKVSDHLEAADKALSSEGDAA